MSKTIDLSIDQRELDREAQLLITCVLVQTARAVGGQTRALEKDLENLTKQHVKGNLYRSWASEVYPRGGKPAYAPKGRVFLGKAGARTRGAMTYWTQPGINRGRRGQWLAIPTEEAGVNTRSRNLTPDEWEARTGHKLEYVPDADGTGARLVARNVVVGRNGRGVRQATSRRLGSANYSGAEIVERTIFNLIPFQRFGNRFAIEPAVDRRRKLLNDDVDRRMKRLRRAADNWVGD